MIGPKALLQQELEKAKRDLEMSTRDVESAQYHLDREKDLLAIRKSYVNELKNAIEHLELQEWVESEDDDEL